MSVFVLGFSYNASSSSDIFKCTFLDIGIITAKVGLIHGTNNKYYFILLHVY